MDIVYQNDQQVAEAQPNINYWARVRKNFRHDRVGMICAVLLAAISLAAIFAPLLPLQDPYAGNMLGRLLPLGTPDHLLGTDELGRDLLSRIIYGGRLSLLNGVLPIAIAFIIGGSLGMLAGYAGGVVNAIIMRTTDVFFAFPSVLLAVAISGTLGAGLANILLSLTIVFIPQITRIAESATAQVRYLDFIQSAMATGASGSRIIRVHILPNVLGPVFVYATGLISVSIIVAAGLSFLGIGTQPPEPEWGLMLNSLRTVIYKNPLISIIPGVMIFLVSVCFSLLSDSLRGAMDLK